MVIIRVFLFLFCFSFVFGHQQTFAQTIAQKKANMSGSSVDLDPEMQHILKNVNQELAEKHNKLHQLYLEVMQLYEQNASSYQYKGVLDRINALRADISFLESNWRKKAASTHQEEGYALWHQPDITLEQLVMDYGSQDYVYAIPSDIGAIKISVNSNIPIPRASWNEMLELILNLNGVGIRQLNPYLRELYLIQQSNAGAKLVTNNRQDLSLFPNDTRLAFILSPDPTDVRRIWFFLDKFVNHTTTTFQQIGRDILIIGNAAEIRDLLRLYDFVASNSNDKEYKLVTLMRLDASEMAKILEAIFDQMSSLQRPSSEDENSLSISSTLDSNGLKILTMDNMPNALVLIGTREEVCKAESIIREMEEQVGDVTEKTIYWYTVKHSTAEELAQVLEKVYQLMVKEKIALNGSTLASSNQENIINITDEEPLYPQQIYHESFYQDGSVAVDPAPVDLVPPERIRVDENRKNFIVDVKTGSIVMVVEADILPKIKDLIRKLDVPKKMVQIEVLLVERKLMNTTNYGLTLLRTGGLASQKNLTSILFNDFAAGLGCKGIFQFILSRPREHGHPAFDLIYTFLFSQQDLQINASPSVLTINQTPARIAIVEEISLNTGVFEVKTGGGDVALKDAFTRAQYGITMEIIPTIHTRSDDDEYASFDDSPDYLTLETNVNFDTFQFNPADPNRPTVTRRNITNETLIPDGQTVILGGLRRKNIEDGRDAIPLLGEIPGIGKLFSYTTMSDSSTEMFIFITPKIIYDPVEDLERVRCEQLSKRPGDIPDFLCCLVAAQEMEKERILAQTMQMLLGRPAPACYPTGGEYDGR